MALPQTDPALSNQSSWFFNFTGDQNHVRSLEIMWIPGSHTRDPDLWDPGLCISETSASEAAGPWSPVWEAPHLPSGYQGLLKRGSLQQGKPEPPR